MQRQRQRQHKLKHLKPYLFFILLSLAVGGVSGVITAVGMPYYETVNKPPFTPPSILFPIVWSVLYILMGIGAARVWKSDAPGRAMALTAYGVQLAINFLWTFWFFGVHLYFVAFLWLLLLLAAVAWMALLFYRIDKPAGLLQIPYLLWRVFAAILNFSVWLLNR